MKLVAVRAPANRGSAGRKIRKFLSTNSLMSQSHQAAQRAAQLADEVLLVLPLAEHLDALGVLQGVQQRPHRCHVLLPQQPPAPRPPPGTAPPGAACRWPWRAGRRCRSRGRCRPGRPGAGRGRYTPAPLPCRRHSRDPHHSTQTRQARKKTWRLVRSSEDKSSS